MIGAKPFITNMMITLKFFPHMNKKDGLQISINMECQK